jgi:alanyl-tRNA synthetase
MTERHLSECLFLDDSTLLEFDAVVRTRRTHAERPAVVLDRTAFYAESGGQPGDTGTLDDVRVLDVVEQDGELLHVLERPLAGERVHGRVDGARRRDHSQQHHGQHLLSRAFVLTARAETLAFHLGSDVTTIDLDRPVTSEQARDAERLANETVWQARAVRVTNVPVAQARAEGLKVPEGVSGEVRIVDVADFDRQPCGGTHPRTTAEVGVILLTGLERHKGGTRVSFVCGHRALAASARRQDVLDRLVATLSAPLDELVTVAQKSKDGVLAAERKAQALLERALDGDARRLLEEALRAQPAASPAVVVETLDGWPPGDLRLLASKLVALAPCVALLASRAEKAHLVFAQSEGLRHDIPALLKRAVAELGGRGGGRGNLAQGGGDRLDLLDAVLSRAGTAVRG